MKQLIFLIFIGLLFIRSGCNKGKKGKVDHFPIEIIFTLENGFDKPIRLRFDWSDKPSESVDLALNKQFISRGKIAPMSGWTNEPYFMKASSKKFSIENKIFEMPSQWKMIPTNADDVYHYYYRITSADTVLVKKLISKEQPAAATEAVSSTPSS